MPLRGLQTSNPGIRHQLSHLLARAAGAIVNVRYVIQASVSRHHAAMNVHRLSLAFVFAFRLSKHSLLRLYVFPFLYVLMPTFMLGTWVCYEWYE